MQNYDLESLIKTFESHANEFDKSLIVDEKRRKDNGLESLAPGHDFNLPRALNTICVELKALRKYLED